MNKIFFLFSVCLVAFSCSKKDGGPDNQTGAGMISDIDAVVLMGSTGKRWQLDKATLTYYSATGSVDSTVTLNGAATPCSIYFTDNRGVGGLNLNYDATAPLTKALPRFGVWALTQSTQKLMLSCLSPYCNGTDGEWSIIYYVKTYITNVERFKMERTLSLAAGRTVRHHLEFTF